jgi:hypothetical protein
MTFEEEEADPADDRYLSTVQVKKRYGIARHNDMKIKRWQKNPRVRLPQPDLVVNARRFWKLSTLLAWERERLHDALNIRGMAREDEAERKARPARKRRTKRTTRETATA